MIKLCSISEYTNEYRTLPVVLIGAGKNASGIINDYEWNIIGAVDNNKDLISDTLKSKNGEVCISAWDDLYSVEFDECALMITPNTASALIDQVENDPRLKDRIVFVYVYMCALQWDIDRIKMSQSDFRITKGEQIKIPKIIHYFWFSGDPYPEKVCKCIESWKKYCPDYELKKWDLENYKTENTFCNEALSVRNWAFASDYGRCDVLRQYGGIYLDTDVELLRPLDDLLYDEGFFNFESAEGVDPGTGMGAVKGNHIFDEICKQYEGIHYLNEDGSYNRVSILEQYTDVLVRHGLIRNGQYQRIDGVAVYPPLVMSPYSYFTGITSIYDKTYGIHHWVSAWISKEYRYELDRRQQYISSNISNLFDRVQ